MNEVFNKYRQQISLSGQNAFRLLSDLSKDLDDMKQHAADRHKDIEDLTSLVIKMQDIAYIFEECRIVTKKPGKEIPKS